MNQLNESAPTHKYDETLHLTTSIVRAYLSNNAVGAQDIPNLIRAIHTTLESLGKDIVLSVDAALKPAVPTKKSVTPEFIICLEDGKKLKMLKRYLRTRFSMTPDEYRTKWGLGPDYPMVAPNYAAQRSDFAKKIGLGRGGRPRTNRRGRRKAA